MAVDQGGYRYGHSNRDARDARERENREPPDSKTVFWRLGLKRPKVLENSVALQQPNEFGAQVVVRHELILDAGGDFLKAKICPSPPPRAIDHRTG